MNTLRKIHTKNSVILPIYLQTSYWPLY